MRVTILLFRLEGSLIDAAIALILLESGVKPPLPAEYEFRASCVCAQAFVCAINTAGQLIRVIARCVPAAAAFPDKFKAAFPTVAALRDTIQHVEDRIRSLGKNEVPLQLQPVNDQVIDSPSGALLIDVLNGREFGSTTADGHYTKFEITEANLIRLRDLIQELLDVLPWSGEPRESPVPPMRRP